MLPGEDRAARRVLLVCMAAGTTTPGGTAVAAAGLAGIASPATAVGSGTADLPAGSTFMAWKGVTGDQQIWWNSYYGGWTVVKAPGTVCGTVQLFWPVEPP